MIDISLKAHKKGQLRDFKKGAWVDIVDPSEEELRHVSKATSLPLYELQEYSDPAQRTMYYENRDHFIIVLKHIQDKKIMSVSFIISKYGSISMHKYPIKFFDEMKENVKEDYLFQLIDKIINEFFHDIEDIQENASKVEDELMEKCDETTLKKIFYLKKSIGIRHKALVGNREVLHQIVSNKPKFLKEETLKKLRTTYNDILQVLDSLDTTRETVSYSFDIYTSSVSNNLNNVMKVLTVVASLLLLPTLISGIYGMNFKIMPELGWKYGYYWALFLMISSMFLMWTWFRKKGWV